MYRQIPRAYPGEWSNGHLKRALIQRGLKPRQLKKGGVKCLLGDLNSKSPVEALAIAARYSVDDYVLDHTLIPFSRAIASRYLGVPHGSQGACPAATRSAFTYLRQEVFACRQCDVMPGASFIRRVSQIPGFNWCLQCGDPLQKIEAEKAAARPPIQWIAQSVSSGISENTRDNIVVARYIAIAQQFLGQKKALSVRDVSKLLAGRMKALGLRVHPASEGLTLSRYLKDRVPMVWLEALFPDIVRDDLCAAIDCVGLSAYTCSGPAYSLACASLFDCPNEALDTLTSYAALKQQELIVTGTKEFTAANLEEVIDLYVAGGGRCGSAATLTDANSREISKIFMLCGLPGIRDLPRPEWLALRDFYSGAGLMDAASKHEADMVRLEPFLRKAGGAFAKALEKLEPRPCTRGRNAKGKGS